MPTPKAEGGTPRDQGPKTSDQLVKILALMDELRDDSDDDDDRLDTDRPPDTALEKQQRIVRSLAAYYEIRLTTNAILEDLVLAIQHNRNGLGTELKDALGVEQKRGW